MYDSKSSATLTPYLIPAYPLKHIKTRIALYAGGADSLVDHKRTLRELCGAEIVRDMVIENYEHLDFLWAFDVKEKVYDDVVSILKNLHKPTV